VLVVAWWRRRKQAARPAEDADVARVEMALHG
jgi:hypothetical protein